MEPILQIERKEQAEDLVKAALLMMDMPSRVQEFMWVNFKPSIKETYSEPDWGVAEKLILDSQNAMHNAAIRNYAADVMNIAKLHGIDFRALVKNDLSKSPPSTYAQATALALYLIAVAMNLHKGIVEPVKNDGYIPPGFSDEPQTKFEIARHFGGRPLDELLLEFLSESGKPLKDDDNQIAAETYLTLVRGLRVETVKHVLTDQSQNVLGKEAKSKIDEYFEGRLSAMPVLVSRQQAKIIAENENAAAESGFDPEQTRQILEWYATSTTDQLAILPTFSVNRVAEIIAARVGETTDILGALGDDLTNCLFNIVSLVFTAEAFATIHPDMRDLKVETIAEANSRAFDLTQKKIAREKKRQTRISQQQVSMEDPIISPDGETLLREEVISDPNASSPYNRVEMDSVLKSLLSGLSPKHQQVAALMASGYDQTTIARMMNLNKSRISQIVSDIRKQR